MNADNIATIRPLSINDQDQLVPQTVSLTLSQRQLCDLELLLNGGFAPLTGFMGQADYESVLETMRLQNGALWPMPVTLDVDKAFADTLSVGQAMALHDPEGLLVAIMTVSDKWEPDLAYEAQAVFGTVDDAHPGVAYLFRHTRPVYIGGTLKKVALPCHYDFRHLRQTPIELKERFLANGWHQVVAFQTRNPMHRAHQELTIRATEQTGAKLLIHPVVGMTKPGDIEYYLRVRCYEHVLSTYPAKTAMLSLLPLAMRMGGPKEALWHALIRKNYGCTHFIVGRDHAGPGKDRQGNPFYGPYAAQELAMTHQQEMGITIVPFQEMLYSHQQKRYFSADVFPANETPASISGTELRERLRTGAEIPAWFSYPAVIDELRKAYPPKDKQGFTLFLTGLPSSGKSTLANALALRLRELTDRRISLLDGDIIRTHLSKGLGFSQEDRETNITRVGFVAKEITSHGGIAICALVAPFAKPRQMVRDMVSEVGGYIEVYVATPLSICETRDRKGLYKKAREGLVKQFTGISDPYEEPANPDILINTTDRQPEDIVNELINQIKRLGYLA